MHLTRLLAAEGIPPPPRCWDVSQHPSSPICAKSWPFVVLGLGRRKETKLAVDFNALGTAWNEIAAGAATAASRPVQSTIDFEGNS